MQYRRTARTHAVTVNVVDACTHYNINSIVLIKPITGKEVDIAVTYISGRTIKVMG
jgi:hypothetical protein